MTIDALKARVKLDLEAIETVHNHLSRLRARLAGREPSADELAAMAAYLHSLYGGLENVLKLLAEFHGLSPGGPQVWHARLVERFTDGHPERTGPPLITGELKSRLDELRGFRHVFRSHYTFRLEWAKLSPLADAATETLRLFRDSVLSHLAAL